MKYKVGIDVNKRGTVIVSAANVDEAAHKAQNQVARAVKRVMQFDRRPPTSKPGVWFVTVKMATERDVASYKRRRQTKILKGG